MAIRLPKDVRYILKLLSSNFDAFVVGGCVRDSIIGREVNDWDITTSAKPNEVVKLFSKFRTVLTGEKHGTVTVIINDVPYEITTFRKDGIYSDSRHPDNVDFVSDIFEDLSRRDFTINAIAYNEEEGFVDPFNGISDINNGVVKCVGNPSERFQEDALRILRMYRFSAQLMFGIDDETRWYAKALKDKINTVSPERIRSELSKIILSGNLISTMKNMYFDGVLELIFKPLSDIFGHEQKNPHHIYDVGAHTLIVAGYLKKKEYLKWAGLFHDIGKPLTESFDDNGNSHYYNHEEVSVDLANDFFSLFRFDNETREKALFIIKNHMRECQPNKKSVRKLLRDIGEENFNDFIDFREADVFGQNPAKIDEVIKWKSMMISIKDEIDRDKECFSLSDLAVNGNDLIGIGYNQGIMIGECLNKMLSMVIDEPNLNNKEYLLSFAKEYKRNG